MYTIYCGHVNPSTAVAYPLPLVLTFLSPKESLPTFGSCMYLITDFLIVFMSLGEGLATRAWATEPWLHHGRK